MKALKQPSDKSEQVVPRIGKAIIAASKSKGKVYFDYAERSNNLDKKFNAHVINKSV